MDRFLTLSIIVVVAIAVIGLILPNRFFKKRLNSEMFSPPKKEKEKETKI